MLMRTDRILSFLTHSPFGKATSMPLTFKLLATGLIALVCGMGQAIAHAEDAGLKPVKVFAVSGTHEGKEVDYVAERKDATTFYVFLNATDWARPVARFVKKLDTDVAGGIAGAEDAHVVLVWLSEDAAKGKEYLPKAQMSLSLVRSDWTVFEGQKAGPDGWNVDIASGLTVVAVQKGKEVGRVAFKSVNETDVPSAIKLLKKS